MKILLCEDDANIATITRIALEQIGGHSVTWVTDGEEAYKKGSTEKFDIILLDDMMPKMSGVAVCEAFVKAKNNTAPVIFMSANPQDKKVKEFSSVAIGYIPKPFDPVGLNQQITDILKATSKKVA
jgi:DNA-binding response OmpR family regulator